MPREIYFIDDLLLDELKTASIEHNMTKSALVRRGVRLALDELKTGTTPVKTVPETVVAEPTTQPEFPRYVHDGDLTWFSFHDVCRFLHLDASEVSCHLDDEDIFTNGATPMVTSFGINTLMGVAIDANVDPEVVQRLQTWADSIHV